ncbi:uncharacterized protein K02A2.6-like [Formica exsecta]|uniref:uncharacterized protein K02A2.6-like n=1 Tax=Formica exsecta TaxID=72781 RepID=UPI001141303B|nr:uncharacterized protein K02A2.6-like [Formica exsecta]
MRRKKTRSLLSVWETERYRTDVSGVCGKQERESIKRAPTTPEILKGGPVALEGRDASSLSYTALNLVKFLELPSLCYFEIFIHGEPLRALVDSGSNRTILGADGIRILRQLGVPTRKNYVTRIRTANGQLAEVREEAEVSFALKNQSRLISTCLLPDLAVSCIVGIDFLCEFGIGLDFATTEWYFAKEPAVRYNFESRSETPTVCSGFSDLTPSQTERLENFLKSRIPETVINPGVTSLTEHEIDVGTNRPIKQRCYLVSPKVQEAIHNEVDKMLGAGIIEPSYSEWSNPIVMVKKPNGKYRFCLDFRKVNSVSKKDAYPLPNMNGILDKLRSARYISTIDLSQAYFQILLAKGSREITVFSVPGKGLYHFTRMPYGLTGAPATFQRLLDKIIGPTFEKHLEWLERVLTKIFVAGLTINPEKCEFCRSQVRYLGFIVQRDGLTVDMDKVQPILDYPAPRNIKQTDASSVGIGAVLTQKVEGTEHVVAFASRALADPEKKYSVTKPKAIVSDMVEDLDRWKLILPKELRETALREAHDTPQSGHLGVEKTFHRLAVAYYWPSMFQDAAKYVRQCDVCQRTKVEQANPAGLMGHRVVERPWTIVAADIMGPFPKSKAGFAYVLVVQDLFTKWMECFALRAANGKKICEALREVISRWGTPRFLLTDNGTEYANQTLRAFSEKHGITHTTIPPYHPQANPVERVNRVLKTMIVAFLEKDHREWDEHLRDFRFAYNTAHHSSTGTSPALLNLGREPTPINSIRESSIAMRVLTQVL